VTGPGCRTPGAVFHITITPQAVTCQVDLPDPLGLDEGAAAALESDLHDAVEHVLVRFFPRVRPDA
jgi:hypothetical protein